MMNNILSCLLLALLLVEAGCNAKKDFNAPSNKQQINGVSVKAKFMRSNKHYNDGGTGGSSFAANASTKQISQLLFDVQFESPRFVPDKKTLNYLDFQLQNDFSLEISGDTALPVLVHRVANGKKNVFEYVVAFESIRGPMEPDTNITILYDDKVFGLGRQFFTFRTKDIQ